MIRKCRRAPPRADEGVPGERRLGKYGKETCDSPCKFLYTIRNMQSSEPFFLLKRQLLLQWVGLLLLFSLGVSAQVIPSSRDFSSGWRAAGYSGEIPAPDRIINVRDYGAQGNGVFNDLPAIQSAVAALGGKPGVIFFPAGIYPIPNNKLSIASNVVIRGERSFNTTIIITNYTGGDGSQEHGIRVSAGQSRPFLTIESGYDLHSQTITLADTSSFNVGDYAEIRESNDVAWGNSDWAAGCVGQFIQITNVTGNTLSFANPLRLPYQSTLLPQIRKISPIMNVGFENIRIERVIAGSSSAARDNVATIYFWYAFNCWVRGCEFTNMYGAAIVADYSARGDITGNYIHDAYEFDGGGSGYGVCFEFRSGEFLVENNIFKRLRHSMLMQVGANGNVLGYNYSREQNLSSYADMVCHGNYTYANLFEGNCGAYMGMDASSGHGINGPYNTYFRNRARGASWLFGTYAINVSDSSCSNETFVGNECVGSYTTGTRNPFTYGNNDDGTVKPTGTTNLPDYSYYLGTNVTALPPKPSWWNIPGFIPTYGPKGDGTVPAIGTERDIPARVRWNSGGPYTYGPPSIWGQPTSLTVSVGASASFTVAATGTPVVLYQWYKDGGVLTGQTNSKIQWASVRSADAGQYQALVSDSNGAMRSATATLTVQHPSTVTLVTAANQQPYGVPLPYGYGTQTVAWGITVTNSAGGPIALSVNTQIVCTGWTGTGSVPTSGDSNSVATMLELNSTITWQWTTQVTFHARSRGAGTILGSTNGWYVLGGSVTITGVPSGGVFVGWSGDVPPDQANENPLTLLLDRARSVMGYFPPRGALISIW